MKEHRTTNVSKAVVVLFGVLSIGIILLLSNVDGPLGQLMSSFMGAIGGPMNGLLLLSIFYRKATTKGAMAGTILSFEFIGWIRIGQNFSGAVEKTPYLPPGPTTQCSNEIFSILNTTSSSIRYYDEYVTTNQTPLVNVT